MSAVPKRALLIALSSMLAFWPATASADGPMRTLLTKRPRAEPASLDSPGVSGPDVTGRADLISLEDLARLNAAELEELYAHGDAEPLPVGFVRGKVLIVCGNRFPRLTIRLSRLVWKGKHFDEDGTFVNQWVGFRALKSQVDMGPSLLDGRPTVVLQYPPGTPFFASMRDEVRRIGPDLYLSVVFERGPTPRVRGFIVLQPE